MISGRSANALQRRETRDLAQPQRLAHGGHERQELLGLAVGAAQVRFDDEFREAAVRLVTVEKVPAAKAAADLGMPVHTLRVWVSQSRHFKGSFTPPGGMDWEKKARALEVENRRLKLERDILKKATAFFVRENGGQP